LEEVSPEKKGAFGTNKGKKKDAPEIGAAKGFKGRGDKWIHEVDEKKNFRAKLKGERRLARYDQREASAGVWIIIRS